jgi:type VI secretion system secreted protein VgrG
MLNDLPTSLLNLLDSSTRLHRLEGDGVLGELSLETWCMRESLSQPWELHVTALSLDAGLDIASMLGTHATVCTRLSDGDEVRRSGIVVSAAAGQADGGLARYRLVLQPWLSLLQCTRRSQVWQERSVTEIVESVFSAYPAQAAWRWADDVSAHLAQSANAGVRSYTVQYRETDFAFIQRLLAEEGIAYRFELDDAAPLAHRLVLFADSVDAKSCPEDASSASSLGGRGIRFHQNSPLEEQDAIQALGAERSMANAATAMLSWDYRGKRSVAVSVPAAAAFAGPNAPRLERYDAAGAYAFADTRQAERAGRLAQEAIEARHKRWFAHSTVRTFTAGTRFELTQSNLDALSLIEGSQSDADRRFLVTGIVHAGINNLHKDASDRLASATHHEAKEATALLQPWVADAARERAAKSGYGNVVEAIRASVPWRPLLADETGARVNPKPIALGPLPATVVGPQGASSASGAGEIHTDALGRVKIQFDFQRHVQGEGTSAASTWVRVMQRYAGSGMGLQFIPRVGQEVLVDFADGDIDRPVVIAALYNGRGEGGVPATPGGANASADVSGFADSTDHVPSAQGNLSAGNSPAWHGASADAAGHANSATFSGVKTREFGGAGYNQLVLDDTNQRLRVQLASTLHGTQLNMGHLIHQADNHRGSFRGLGFEMRTDAYGAVRAGRGLLISTFGSDPSEPAGDNAAGMALAQQTAALAETLSGAAATHETVKLAGHVGSFKSTQSAIDPQAAPLKAMHTALKGMVAAANASAAQADASSKNTAPSADKLPHSTDPLVAIAAKAGLGVVAGQDVHVAAGETITFASGQDTQWAVGGAMRMHTGQALGILAGAIKPGEQAAGKGLSMIAARGDVELLAQADAMQIAAKSDVTVQSANAHVDWAAAKKISLSTAAGANITIEGGNVTVQCPGKITVKAGKKSFVGAAQESFALPVMPTSDMLPVKFSLLFQDMPGALGAVPVGQPWRIVVSSVLASDAGTPPEVFDSANWSETLFAGIVGADGAIHLSEQEQHTLNQRVSMQSGRIWFISGLTAVSMHPARWSGRDSDVNPEKIVDALNFAGDGRSLDANKRDWLIELAKADLDVRGVGQLKPMTDS